MKESKKLVSVTCPSEFMDSDNLETFTSGRTYKVTEVLDDVSFNCIDNNGSSRFCLFVDCCHIDELEWILNYE